MFPRFLFVALNVYVAGIRQLSPCEYCQYLKFNSLNLEKPLMKFLISPRLLLAAFAALFLVSCDDEKETFVTDNVNDYRPAAVGKYITYRLDSMVFTNFGRDVEIRKYQVKHVVDAQITDNEGRPAYRIFTYLSDSTGTQPWQPGKTYTVTPLSDQVEVFGEDNRRYIKLHMPVKNNFTWKGNKFVPDNTYNPLYPFSNDDNMQDWDFYYDGEPGTFNYRGNNYSNVLTVEQIDESLNVPITSPTSYASKSRSIERYSKNIGLIYKEYELWEYQPNTGNPAGPYKVGFGITMWMIDHN